MNRMNKILRTIAKNNDVLRIIMRRIKLLEKYKYLYRVKNIPVSEKTVLFNAFNGKSYCCTPKAVYQYMQSQEKYKDYEYIWVVQDTEKYSFLENMPNTCIVKDKSSEYIKALGKAKYWFCNYKIYDYVYPKKNQLYIQCWHGTPLKRLGCDIEKSDAAMSTISEIRNRYRYDAKRFSYLLSPSSFTTEVFATAWDLVDEQEKKKIVEVGYPRDDFLFTFTDENVKDIKQQLGVSSDKKIILYAPTWRDNQHSVEIGFTYKTNVDFEKWKEALGDEYVILFRAHYLVANSFNFEKYTGFVYDVSDYPDINELYVVADMLITDYSSVFFDYANLKRPMIFYMYDLIEYKDNLRGFYLELDELPGVIIETEDNLIECMRSAIDTFEYDYKYIAFNEKYNGLNDGNASERFVNRVIEV